MIDSELQKELNRKYNPKGSTLRIAQLRMLDLLKFIDEICKKNDLSYWIDGGTLLGAARHGGFIPWDDDTDICMPRKDALKLKQILKSEVHEGHIILQTDSTDPHYSNSSWMTIRDLKSRYIQDYYGHNILKYQGLQVDIFMMESNIPPTIKRFSNILQGTLINFPLEAKHNLKMLRPFVDFNHRILNKIIYPSLRLFRNRSQFITYGIGAPFNNQYKLTDIFPLGKIEFEGFEFNCPNDINSYLTNLYGDWETIPDKDDIINHTDNIKLFD